MSDSGPAPKTDVDPVCGAIEVVIYPSEPSNPSNRARAPVLPAIGADPVIERESTRTCPGTSFLGVRRTDIRN